MGAQFDAPLDEFETKPKEVPAEAKEESVPAQVEPVKEGE
jgi:hypothetical protein